jgi:hypothetical protein
VTSRRPMIRANTWTIHQPGQADLAGRFVGPWSLRHRPPFGLFLDVGLIDSWAPLRVSFRGSGSSGFSIVRRIGLAARYRLTLRDPRLDPRVALAAALNINRFDSGDLRRYAIDVATLVGLPE